MVAWWNYRLIWYQIRLYGPNCIALNGQLLMYVWYPLPHLCKSSTICFLFLVKVLYFFSAVMDKRHLHIYKLIFKPQRNRTRCLWTENEWKIILNSFSDMVVWVETVSGRWFRIEGQNVFNIFKKYIMLNFLFYFVLSRLLHLYKTADATTLL